MGGHTVRLLNFSLFPPIVHTLHSYDCNSVYGFEYGAMSRLPGGNTHATPFASNPVEAHSEEPSVTREAFLNDAPDSSKSSLSKNSSPVQLSTATTSNSAPDVPTEGTIIRVATAPNIKKVYRKIDKRVLLWYCLIFAVLKIAERNISNAAIINLEQGTGIKKQLGNLSSSQWAWIMSIFSYPYIALDACSVMLTKKFTPRIWLGRIMVTWVSAHHASGIYNHCLRLMKRPGSHLNVPSSYKVLRWTTHLQVLPRCCGSRLCSCCFLPHLILVPCRPSSTASCHPFSDKHLLRRVFRTLRIRHFFPQRRRWPPRMSTLR